MGGGGGGREINRTCGFLLLNFQTIYVFIKEDILPQNIHVYMIPVVTKLGVCICE